MLWSIDDIMDMNVEDLRANLNSKGVVVKGTKDLLRAQLIKLCVTELAEDREDAESIGSRIFRHSNNTPVESEAITLKRLEVELRKTELETEIKHREIESNEKIELQKLALQSETVSVDKTSLSSFDKASENAKKSIA